MGLKLGLAIWLCLKAIAWPNWSIILDNALSSGCYCFTNLCSKCYCKKPPQNKEMRRTPRMTTKRQNKKEWVRKSLRESEFLLRGLLLQSTRSGSCRLKGQSWIFITTLLPEEPELCPALPCEELAPTLQTQTNTSCTLGEGLVNCWDTILCAWNKLVSCENRPAALSGVDLLRGGGRRGQEVTPSRVTNWCRSL